MPNFTLVASALVPLGFNLIGTEIYSSLQGVTTKISPHMLDCTMSHLKLNGHPHYRYGSNGHRLNLKMFSQHILRVYALQRKHTLRSSYIFELFKSMTWWWREKRASSAFPMVYPLKIAKRNKRIKDEI